MASLSAAFVILLTIEPVVLPIMGNAVAVNRESHLGNDLSDTCFVKNGSFHTSVQAASEENSIHQHQVSNDDTQIPLQKEWKFVKIDPICEAIGFFTASFALCLEEMGLQWAVSAVRC